MARAKFFTDFERDCIRCGIAAGLSCATIARGLGRSHRATWKIADAMKKDGTIGNLPLPPVAEDIADVLRKRGALK